MASAAAAIERLCDPQAEVSAHYLISGQGKITQMVREEDRAWHAGRGSWHGADDINSRSIGSELDNRGNHPFSAPLMDALEILMQGIMTRWGICPDGVIGHSDMAPGLKIDPGRHFDWSRLVRQGLAAQPAKVASAYAVNAKAFRDCARRAGYPGNAEDAALLQAVRDRHRPFATGPLCADDFTSLGAVES